MRKRTPKARRATWLVVTLLALVSVEGLPPAAATGPQPPAIPEAAIVVDGLVDAEYGPPLASDPGGDGNGNANMDLLDLYVAEDASYLYFAFTINDDVTSTNWGKYALYVDTTGDAEGASTDAWTRNVLVNDPHKPEYGLYTWVDAPPYGSDHTQFWAWDGASWGQSGSVDGAASSTTGITSTLEWQVAKTRLGNPEEVWVEVWDTGGGENDNAQDTINDPADDWNASDWSTQAVLDNSTYFDIQGTEPPQPGHDNNVWWDGLEHDSRNDMYRMPFGAVPTQTPITLRFRTYHNDVTDVKVRLWDTHQNGQTILPMSYLTTIPGDPYGYDIWELQLTAPSYLTVLYYRFIVIDGTDTDYYEDDELLDGGLGEPYDNSPDNSWQIDVYDPAFDTPDWFKDAIVYQIFPDRFRNGVSSNDPISGTFFYDEDPGVMTAPQWNWIVPDPRVSGPWEGSYSKLFYGGDLQGIVDKLDYLQDLGITTLYLNPIFESPSNHKYDTTNYEEVDDNFGDLATYQALVAGLDSRGMHLVLDGVFNHTSSDSHYFDRYGRYPGFVGACEDVNSPYRDWYYFSPASPPGTGACDGDTNYVAWWGFDSLPKLNTTDNEAVRTYIYSDTNPSPPPPVATYWLEEGADGWRLDVAGDVHSSFWQEWRPFIRGANADAITIAEEWGDASHFVLGDQLDTSMNYRFRNAVIGMLRETDWQDTNSAIPALSISEYDSVMHGIEEDYPPEAYYAMMNLVGSHDTNRVLIPLDQDGDPTDVNYTDGRARQRVMAILQLTSPGAPTIYYGDEVGLVGYGEPDGGGTFYSDPYNRQPYPWQDEAGYGDLPEWRQPAPGMLNYYSILTAIRNGNPALRTGSFDTLLTDDDNRIYAFGRKLGDDAAVVIIQRKPDVGQTVTIDVSGYLPEGTALTDELNGNHPHVVSGGQIAMGSMPDMSGAVLTVDAGQDLTPPDPPANLAATEGDGTVGLGWDAAAGAAAYHVYRSYVSGGGYTRVATSTVGTTFDDTTVDNGRTYFYVVTALDAPGNESERSNEAEALPHAAIDWAGDLEPAAIVHTIGITPTEPISAQVWIDGLTTPPGQGEGLVAELGFGPTGTPSDTWEVWVPMHYAADVGSNDQYTATLTPELTGAMDYAARFSTTQGREWTYALTAATQPGSLTVQPSADTTPPDTPQNLAVADWSAEWVALEWDPVSGDPTMYGYDIYRSEAARSTGGKIARVLAPETTFTDNSVTTGQTYTYTVQAVDTSFNKSGQSNAVQATAEAKLAEVTFQAVVPEYTPEDATVYVVGDVTELCGWCNPQAVAMDRTGDVTWTKTITLTDGQAIQYKYSRGTWDVVEWWGPIVSVFNRHATVDYGADGTQVLADTVHYWRDPLVIEHAPAAEGTGVAAGAPISVTISRFLDPATITAENLVVASATATPAMDIGYYHHTEMTATTILMTPTVALEPRTRYTATLQTGLAGVGWDNEGIALQRPYDWSFSTAGPILSITKEVSPQSDVPLGGAINYTIVVANTGDAGAVGVTVTDTLPAGVSGDDLEWMGDVTAGGLVLLGIPGTVTTDTAYYGQTINNTAYLNHTSGSDSASAAFTVEEETALQTVYLPIVLKGTTGR